MNLREKRCKTVTVTDSVFVHNKLYWMLGIIPMKPKTFLVVIEVVSKNLDEHKNNGLIFNLQ